MKNKLSKVVEIMINRCYDNGIKPKQLASYLIRMNFYGSSNYRIELARFYKQCALSDQFRFKQLESGQIMARSIKSIAILSADTLSDHIREYYGLSDRIR